MTPGGGPRLRVAMLAPSLRGGGLERVVRDLALGLDPERFEVRVFTIGGLGVLAGDLTEAGIPAVDCSEPNRIVRGIPKRLIGELHRFRPNVVHAHSGTWYAACVAKTVLRLPVLIYTEHGRYPPEPWTRSVVERWCAWCTDGLYAVSSVTAAYLQDFLRIRRKPGVLPNGVDLSRYQPIGPHERASLRAEWGIEPNDVVAISVGRFVPVKNQPAIIRALAESGEPRLRVVFVGSGELEGDAKALARSLGVEDHTRFLGFRDDVARCLGAADMFVNASSTEGQPLSILEAMATGLPVIATDVGGVPEVLGSPPVGALVPAGDGAALERSLVSLCRDNARRNDLSHLARARADAYSLETFLGRHAKLYLESTTDAGSRPLRAGTL